MANGGVGLLSLPDELLDRITLHVHQDSYYKTDAPTLLLCRRVSRLAQKHLYRCPTAHRNGVFDKERLDLFNQALRSRPKLRELVQQIELAPVCKRKRTNKRETAYLDRQGVAELSSLLLRLPNATEVTLQKFERDNLDELLYTFACMPRVSRVTMDVPDAASEWTEGFWSRLADMPALRHLTIRGSSSRFHLPPTSVAFPGLEELRVLELPDSFVDQDVDATSLAALTPRLEMLVVNSRSRRYYVNQVDSENDGEGDAQSQYSFLRCAPASLSRLHIKGTADLERNDALLSIPGLRQLTLGLRSDLAQLVPVLYQTDIEHIRLEPGANAGDEDIAALFVGQLSLNHVCVDELPLAWRLQDLRDKLLRRSTMDFGDSLTTSEALGILQSLSSRWPRGCSEDGIERAFKLAEKAGVVVDGNAVGCLEWNRLVKVEFERMLVNRIATAHALVVDCIGAARAAEAVQQHQPDLASRIEGDGESSSRVDDGESNSTVS